MRLQERPRFRASASVRFAGEEGFAARRGGGARALAVGPAPRELPAARPARGARTPAPASGDAAVLVLGFEIRRSRARRLDGARRSSCCRDGGGLVPEGAGATRSGEEGAREGAAGAWRNAFLNAPYLRDVLVRAAVISETFETAITWDRFENFHAEVMQATRDAVTRVCGSGSVACRFTHVYPDGPAPYYTVLAPGRRGSELEQWAEIKAAASEALLAAGGTITHHHAVGRDHRPWYDRERPDAFARALRAAKRELDPAGVLNPGVLFDCKRSAQRAAASEARLPLLSSAP